MPMVVNYKEVGEKGMDARTWYVDDKVYEFDAQRKKWLRDNGYFYVLGCDMTLDNNDLFVNKPDMTINIYGKVSDSDKECGDNGKR